MSSRQRILVCLAFVALLSVHCKQSPAADLPIDKNATPETVALYRNLRQLDGKHILFGQQDATAYGVGRTHPDSSYCDARDVTGSYPALYGWDIGHISRSANVDDVGFQKIRRLIREAYSRGGVISISWHEGNPGAQDNVNDITPTVKRMLPGGDLNGALAQRLRLVAGFFKSLTDDRGQPIPVIFRPYHEHNGDWFWWCTKSCSEEEYKALFRYTVHFLRDSLGVHQLLYAISPDKSRMNPDRLERDMLYGYPGDEYIDILGFDNYWDVGNVANYDPSVSRARQDTLFVQSLKTLVRLAERHNKIPALTETGCNAMTETDWFTARLLKPLHNHPEIRKIAWILVWRNANTRHFYVPYPGHPACADFITFKNDPLILFEDEMPPMYGL